MPQQRPTIENLISNSPPLKLFICYLKGNEGRGQPVLSFSRSKARYSYLLEVRDCYPGLTFSDIVVRSWDAVQKNDDVENQDAMRGVVKAYFYNFKKACESWGISFAKLGMKVGIPGGKWGYIVGASHYLQVLSGQGHVVYAHPTWGVTYYDEEGFVVCSFPETTDLTSVVDRGTLLSYCLSQKVDSLKQVTNLIEKLASSSNKLLGEVQSASKDAFKSTIALSSGDFLEDVQNLRNNCYYLYMYESYQAKLYVWSQFYMWVLKGFTYEQFEKWVAFSITYEAGLIDPVGNNYVKMLGSVRILKEWQNLKSHIGPTLKKMGIV